MIKYKGQKLLVFDAFQNIPKSISVFASLLTGFGIEVKDFPKCRHQREDFHKISKKYPIFAVSDGVTLELDKKGNYPKISGAGKVAEIFCEIIIKEAEKRYCDFTVPDLKKIFSDANLKIAEYNQLHGRIKDKINYWDFDLFASTGSYAIIKDKFVYWASMCDSSVIHLKKDGEIAFKSPNCWNILRKNLPANWLKISKNERKMIIRRTYRNGVDKNGKLIGYGVITGEKEAERYLNFGKFEVEEGDVVMVLTDGFENYIKMEDFTKLFSEWPKNIKTEFKKITNQKSTEDPDKFGRERTIIVVKVY